MLLRLLSAVGGENKQSDDHVRLKHSFVSWWTSSGCCDDDTIFFFVFHDTVIFKHPTAASKGCFHVASSSSSSLLSGWVERGGVWRGGRQVQLSHWRPGFTVPLMTEKISKDTLTPPLHLFPSFSFSPFYRLSPAVIFQPVLLLRHSS